MQRRTIGRALGSSLGLAALLIAAQLGVERATRPVATTLGDRVGDADRGAYMARLAGCVACHTNGDGGPALAGGRRLETPFGTFITPNITPDVDAGIGGWTLEQFHVAMTQGVSPDGEHYYPAFPFTSYARMTRQDVADLKAYLDTVEPSSDAVADHALSFPFSKRATVAWWKWLFFDRSGPVDDERGGRTIDRGEYIVSGPGHCGECHTPRNWLGGMTDRLLEGTATGPDGSPVPPLRGPGSLDGWTKEDLVFALEVGMTPDGDALGGSMGEVIEHGTSHLSLEDLEAIAEFLLSDRDGR